MNSQALRMFWDQIRQKYGVLLRVLEVIPEPQLHAHPIPGMRTPAELAAHVAGSIVRDIAVGVAKGAITADESREADIAAGLTSRASLLDHLRDCWARADAAVATITDSQLAASVPTPWGMSFPGAFAFHVLNDELLHHRGQLYAYARACGVEPPSLWSFAENEPVFQHRT
jgi:uncharacterized damage-inducible protein DinB